MYFAFNPVLAVAAVKMSKFNQYFTSSPGTGRSLRSSHMAELTHNLNTAKVYSIVAFMFELPFLYFSMFYIAMLDVTVAHVFIEFRIPSSLTFNVKLKQ